MTAYALPRPRVTVHSGEPERLEVDFGRSQARIWVDPEDRSAHPSLCYRWRLTGDVEATGHTYGRERAFRSAWCRAAQAEAPPRIDLDELSDADARSLAYHAEFGELGEAVRHLRMLLRRRTGRAWSVRAGRGRERGAVLIASLPADRVDGSMTAADAALLAAVLRLEYVGPSGVTVPPKLGARTRAVLAAVGLAREELARLDWRTVKAEVERGATVLH